MRLNEAVCLCVNFVNIHGNGIANIPDPSLEIRNAHTELIVRITKQGVAVNVTLLEEHGRRAAFERRFVVTVTCREIFD